MEQDNRHGKAGRTQGGKFAKGKSGNPTGKRKRVAREVRADGYVNAVTGHGTARDRRMATYHRTRVVTDLEALDMRQGSWLAARIIEAITEDAFRRGHTLKVKDKKTSELVQSAVEDLGIAGKVQAAWQMERTCGGAALYPVLDGALGDLSTELDKTKITTFRAVHLLEPRELMPLSWYSDISNPKFGLPETYRLWPVSGGRGGSFGFMQTVHESRLAIFPGLRFTREFMPGQRLGWGDSVLTRPIEVLNDVGLSWGSAATILHNFSQRVFKYKGLNEILKDDGGEQAVQKRAMVMDMMANVLRALPLDAEDDLVVSTIGVSGLADLLVQFAQLISAAADTPVTRLFGMSPSGMNATGQYDDESWDDRVGNGQSRMTPHMEWLIQLLLLSADGPTKGKEPEMWSLEWKPLKNPTEKETAETRKLNAEADKIWFDMGAVSSDDVANSHWGGDTYSMELTVDFAAREAQKKIDEEQQAALVDAQALAAMGAKPPVEPAPVPAPGADE